MKRSACCPTGCAADGGDLGQTSRGPNVAVALGLRGLLLGHRSCYSLKISEALIRSPKILDPSASNLFIVCKAPRSLGSMQIASLTDRRLGLEPGPATSVSR